MISIKRSLSDLDEKEERFQASLECYLSAISQYEEHVLNIMPEATQGRHERFRRLRDDIAADPTRQSLETSSVTLESEVKDFCEHAKQALVDKEERVREILHVVAEAASVISSQTENFGRLEGFTEQMEVVSRLNDLEEVRRRLSEEVGQLKTWVESRSTENRASVMKLKHEMEMFRQRADVAEKLAFMDELTGLGNRREGERDLQQKIRQKSAFCLILIDVNRFRWINDRYGHNCGDQVLKLFSQRLVLQFRATDTICRWGGDEFLVLMECSVSDAMRKAYQIGPRLRGRYTVTSHEKEITLDVGASLGVAEYLPGETLEDFLARADSVLGLQRAVEPVK